MTDLPQALLTFADNPRARRDYDDRFVTSSHDWILPRDDADDNWDHDWGDDERDEPRWTADGDLQDSGSGGADAEDKWNPGEWDSIWAQQQPGRGPAEPGATGAGGAAKAVDLSKSGNEWGHSAQKVAALPAAAPAGSSGGESRVWRFNGLNGDFARGGGGGGGGGGNGTGGATYRGDCGELDPTVCSATPRCVWSFFTGCGLRSLRQGRGGGRVYVERDYPANPVAETLGDLLTGPGRADPAIWPRHPLPFRGRFGCFCVAPAPVMRLAAWARARARAPGRPGARRSC